MSQQSEKKKCYTGWCSSQTHWGRFLLLLIVLAAVLYLAWPYLLQMNKDAQHHHVKEVADRLNTALQASSETARAHLIDGPVSIERYDLGEHRHLNVLLTNYGSDPLGSWKNAAFETRYFSIVGAVSTQQTLDFNQKTPILLSADEAERIQACMSIFQLLLHPHTAHNIKTQDLLMSVDGRGAVILNGYPDFSAIQSAPFSEVDGSHCVWLHKSDYFAIRYNIPSQHMEVISWALKDAQETKSSSQSSSDLSAEAEKKTPSVDQGDHTLPSPPA